MFASSGTPMDCRFTLWRWVGMPRSLVIGCGLQLGSGLQISAALQRQLHIEIEGHARFKSWSTAFP